MLEWLIAVGALSGAIGALGVLYILVDLGVQLRRWRPDSHGLPPARIHRIVRR